jgi:hypothetical protein
VAERPLWWPPALRRSLTEWQQLAEAQEIELIELRRLACGVVDTFDRRPTDSCVKNVIGLAESLQRYREMRSGIPQQLRLPRTSQQRPA